MSAPVYILGGYQTDFAKAWARNGQAEVESTKAARARRKGRRRYSRWRDLMAGDSFLNVSSGQS